MKRLLVILLGIAAALCLVAGTCAFAIYSVHAYRLNAYRAELRAKGEPLDILSAAPLRSADSETTEKLLAACAALQEAWTAKESPPLVLGSIEDESDAEGRLPLVTQRPRPAMKTSDGYGASWEEAASNLAFLDPYLDAIRAAAKAPNLGVEPDYSKGYKAFRSFPEIQTAAKCLSSHCTLALRRGDAEAAVQDIETQLTLAGALQNAAFVVPQMEASLVVAYAFESTFTLENSGLTDSTQLARLQHRFEIIARGFKLVSSLRAERALLMPLLNVPDSASFLGGLPTLASGQVLPDKFFHFWWWRYMDRDEEMLGFLKTSQSWIDGSASAEKSGTWRELLNTIRSLDADDFDASGIIARPTLMILQQVPAFIIQTRTKSTLAATSLALERYKRDHGEYPQALADMVPQYLSSVPVDLYDGNPLRYERKSLERFSLFSIGCDALEPLKNTTVVGSQAITWPILGDTAGIAEKKPERPRLIPKKFVRRLAAPTPTPAQRSPRNNP